MTIQEVINHPMNKSRRGQMFIAVANGITDEEKLIEIGINAYATLPGKHYSLSDIKYQCKRTYRWLVKNKIIDG